MIESSIAKYSKQIKPKWWEWIPIVSFTYENRMSNCLKDFQPEDPDKHEVMTAFKRAFLYSLGLSFIIVFVTPLFSYLLSRRVVNRLEK